MKQKFIRILHFCLLIISFISNSLCIDVNFVLPVGANGSGKTNFFHGKFIFPMFLVLFFFPSYFCERLFTWLVLFSFRNEIAFYQPYDLYLVISSRTCAVKIGMPFSMYVILPISVFSSPVNYHPTRWLMLMSFFGLGSDRKVLVIKLFQLL